MNKVVLSLFILLSGTLALWVKGLPDYLLSPRESAQVLKIHDRHGIRIKSYAPGESYDWISLADIPTVFVRMILQSEDRNFYTHSGLDLKGSLRSAIINFRNFRILTGASTLSQQVYRLHHKVPRTWKGKIETIVGALLIERKYSKEIILTHYLNSLPYGKRLVGIRRASEVLFGKPVKELSLAEIAVLAVAPRSPSLLLSDRNHSLLIRKRNELLKKYADSYGIANDVLSYELKTKMTLLRDESGWDNYHYVQRIMNDPQMTMYLKTGSLHTTLDSYLQRDVSLIARAHLAKLRSHNAHNSSVVVLDNNTGDVLAYLGSASVTGDNGNHIDGLLSHRQPGSVMKPFTYALALEKGMPLNSIIPDIPAYYKTGKGQYLPRNYDRDYTGPRLMREALGNSLNLPAVALADTLGVPELYDFLVKLGFSFSRKADHYGVGLTLGNAELTPMELARSYTSFPAGEIMVEPRFLSDVPVIQRPVPISKETAFLIRNVLSDRIARREAFGDGNIFEVPFELSVKTGTSTDFRDNWTVGFNRFYTVLVWVGNMNQEPMKRVSGISGAGPIMTDIMKLLMKNKFVPLENHPPEITRVEICALSGMSPGKFCSHKSMEFLPRNHNLSVCSYHREILVRSCDYPGDEKKIIVALYPEIYQNFELDHPAWTLAGQTERQCLSDAAVPVIASASDIDVQISKPLTGSVYAIDPNIPRKFQRLEIQLNRSLNLKTITWKIDNEFYTGSAADFDWQMEKGKHQIEAEVELSDGTHVTTDRVEVTVL